MFNPCVFETHHQQRSFRKLLEAFSYPGRLVQMPTEAPALQSLLACLIDGEASLADPHQLLSREAMMQLEGCIEPQETARFVVLQGSRSDELSPSLGTLENPELGATLVVLVDDLSEGLCYTLEGPGIATHTQCRLAASNSHWLERRACWNQDFPMGVDLIFADTFNVLALPRTTQVTEAAAWVM